MSDVHYSTTRPPSPFPSQRPPPSPSPSSSSTSPSLSTSLSSSSSSLSTALLRFFNSPDRPASGSSGGALLLLAASVISQSSFRLKCQWTVRRSPVELEPPSHFTVDGRPEYEHRTFASWQGLQMMELLLPACIWQEIFFVLHRLQGSFSSSTSSPSSGSSSTG
ncbi:hypothetical protein F5879DRAFT_995670 [Lentinula edodes]|nr:hypothetical protein F5879DRAFT_995670 [Lentinula edodes]